jgi:RNA polymerase sigma factor (sigma-70 family)
MNPINWNEIYTNISPKLLGICRRYIKDIATAEDIVQDSFMVAIQKENTLKDANSLHGWLSRIVINMAIHHLKENKKIIFSTSENFEVIDTSTTMNTSELDNKSKLLASDLDSNDVLEAIDSLPEHHKSVFNMYVIDQFSHNDIAKTLYISTGTSKSHLSRARKSIQLFLLEKLKGKTIDENKKRKMAFLLFLGFGNNLFANFYKSKFRDFEIVPKNPFSLAPKNISVPSNFIGLTKAISLAKIAIASIGTIAFIGIGAYFYNSNTSSEKENNVVIENKTESIIVPKIDSMEAKSVTLKSIPEKKVAAQIITKEKNKMQPSVSKTDLIPVAALLKDTAKTEDKKVVVIKKQIIKRDTVYVTK